MKKITINLPNEVYEGIYAAQDIAHKHNLQKSTELVGIVYEAIYNGTLITDANSQSQTTSNQTWILEDNIFRCPCCGYWFDADFFDTLPNYCIDCGADLREEKIPL